MLHRECLSVRMDGHATGCDRRVSQGEIAMHYVGIDWAMEKHDICVQADDGQVISQTVVTHDWDGFQELQALLNRLQDVRIVIERSEGLLVDWLVTNGWEVYMMHPTVLAHRRPRRSKDDRGDAYLLAYLLRTGDPDCRPIPHQSPLVRQLKQAAITYHQTKADQRRHANRLMYLLRQYYPAVIQAFPTVYSLTCLAFLEAFPTPEAAKALSLEALEAFLKAQRYSARTGRLPHIYAALQKPMPRALTPEAYVVRRDTPTQGRSVLWRIAGWSSCGSCGRPTNLTMKPSMSPTVLEIENRFGFNSTIR